MTTTSPTTSSKGLNWRDAVAGYQNPDVRRSVWQIINSIVPYILLWVAMYYSLRVSYFLTLALGVLAGGFMTRIFIIFHDCGHGSFFKSKKANDFWGFVTGIMTLTPYGQWRHDHALHHASSGDLDRRGFGDVWTLTTKEYLALPWQKRLWYRVFRHPLILFGIGPFYTFAISHRFANRDANARDRKSVVVTNLVLLAVVIALHFVIGIKAFILIQLPILMIGGAAGLWLFYVQHTFEPPYWEHHEDWDFVTAALEGSSFYKLPKVLQWFSGNIGFHHIHHLSPRIPNYKLPECQEASEIFHNVEPLTIMQSLRSLNLRVWDEELRRMLSFREVRRLYGAHAQKTIRAGS
jgi:acyl-lipid omega-6 desaturase (Delta-12 desaturase)